AHVVFFCQRRGLGDCDGLRSASGYPFAGKLVGGSETPGAVHDDANAEAERFALAERANFAALGGEGALAEMHDSHVGGSGAAEVGSIQGLSAIVPHGGNDFSRGAPTL